jgi:LPXTG-motif cell wall-anchored protein
VIVIYVVKTTILMDAEVSYFTDSVKTTVAEEYRTTLGLPATANITVVVIPASVYLEISYTTNDATEADTATAAATTSFATASAVQASIGDAIGVTALSGGETVATVTIILPASGMGVGVIIAIVIGVLAGFGLGFLLYKKRKDRKAKTATFPA